MQSPLRSQVAVLGIREDIFIDDKVRQIFEEVTFKNITN